MASTTGRTQATRFESVGWRRARASWSSLERPQHLRRGDAARQRRGEEGPGGKADVDVEVGGLAVDEEIVERLEAPELVGAPRDRPAGEDHRDARVALADREVALVDDRAGHDGACLLPQRRTETPGTPGSAPCHADRGSKVRTRRQPSPFAVHAPTIVRRVVLKGRAAVNNWT